LGVLLAIVLHAVFGLAQVAVPDLDDVWEPRGG
jgi:hypothetical protein